MRKVAAFTPREVAVLSGAPKRLVEKAIEERVVPVRRGAKRRGQARSRRLLPVEAVAYAAALKGLDLKLGLRHKRRLMKALRRLRPAEMRRMRAEVCTAVEIDLGRLVGDAIVRAERYGAARDRFIAVDEDIMGGTPVIRGTRMTVYSVLGRIDGGESVEDILEDNPDIAREAVEAAITYARAHPLVGRPGGRPWSAAA
jgi:uncharacterized protein (DUF433 family)